MNYNRLKQRCNNYLNHYTFRNIGYLTVGNIISQIISFIGALYIPNLLGPERYGVYNTVFAYVGIFSVFTFSGLNKVVIRESSKDIKNTRNIIESTIGLRNFFSFFAVLLCLIVVLFIDYDKGTKVYIAVYSSSLLFIGFQNSVNSLYQTFEKMKVIAILSIAKNLVLVPLTILFLKLGYGIMSLIIINLIISLVILLVNIQLSKRILSFNLFSRIQINPTYIKSGLNFTILEFLGILSGKIDLVMLSFLTTPEKVGLYSLAFRIVEKGLLIRGPISLSLFPHYSKRFDDKTAINKKSLYNHTLFMLIPSVVICIIVILFSKIAIVTFVGAEYEESAKILNVLVLYLVFNYSVIPFGLFLQTIRKERLSVAISVGTALINISLNYLFYKIYGIIGIAYSTLVVEFFRLISAISISELLIRKK
ncbi:MAG: flippase [Bacteroidales bacterium]|nr:flippase [Bacteroidales bacterium]